MPSRKANIAPSLADTFYEAAVREQTRRREAKRALKENNKREAAEARKAQREAAEKAAATAAFQKKITQETFPSLRSLVTGVFGENGGLTAKITSDEKTGETCLEIKPGYRDTYGTAAVSLRGYDYWITATTRQQELYIQNWGRSIDPQSRGYKRSVTVEELSGRIADMITDYASDAELAKMQKQIRKPRKKAAVAPSASVEKPQGITIVRPLQLKKLPSVSS
jgi:hypothetical protein